MLWLLRWPCLLPDVSTGVYCSKQTGSSSTKETITHHFLRFKLGRKKTVEVRKQNLWRRRKCCWTETQQTFVNGFIGFIALNVYSAGGAMCIAHNNCAELPSIWAALSTLLINILLGSFQLFLHSDQPLSEGEIIPFSGVCQSGRLHYHAGSVVASRMTDRLLMCNRRRPAATSSHWASFSALASANSFVYFASSAATSRWRICMSVIAAFASFSSLAFLSRWAL